MKDNCYAYAMDLSLRKGKNGQYSEPLVYEVQPLTSSNLVGGSNWSYENALAKAFSDTKITTNIEEKVTRVSAPHAKHSLLIKTCRDVSTIEFDKINEGKYTHVHTVSSEKEVDYLNNKVYQRLYLPDEVSPEYRIFQSNATSDELSEKIYKHFSDKGVSKIVLKAAVGYLGAGNVFIEEIQNKEALQKSIEKMQSLNQYPTADTKYFLAEEQKEFPRVSRKTGEAKTSHLTYRLVGIANQDGDVGHFIASKSISPSIDSHQPGEKPGEKKCYFGKEGAKYQGKKERSLTACGPKDKYFGIGEKKIDIDPALMDRISKQIYQLYSDIKSMTDEQFEQHIDSLVELKNTLSSRKERIENFKLPIANREEIIDKNDYYAFSRACEADYEPLAENIARKMIAAKTVNLKQLTEYPNYRQDDQLKTMLTIMEEEKYVKGLLTANTEQLKYCFKRKVAPTLSKTFMEAIIAKKKKLAQDTTQLTQFPIHPVKSSVNNPPEVAATQEKSRLDKQISAQAGSSDYRSRLQTAFFADNSLGEASGSMRSNHKETGNLNIPKSISSLAGLTLFAHPQTLNADQENSENPKKRDYAK